MAKRPTRRHGAADGSSSFGRRLSEVEELTEANRAELGVQFKRMAQLQAQIDEIQAAWKHLKAKKR